RCGRGQAGEVRRVDEPGGDRIGLFESLQGLVQGRPVLLDGLRDFERLVQIDTLSAAAMPHPSFAASLFDEDTAHGQAGRSEEMSPTVPVRDRCDIAPPE